MISFAFGLSIAAILFCIPSLIISILSLSYVIGMKNSTHQIQYVPLNDGLEEKETKKSFEDAFSSSFDDDETVLIVKLLFSLVNKFTNSFS